MIEYKRLDSESDFDYGMRLIEIKMELKPDNLDWQDIIELVGLDIHRDTLRKACQGDFGGYNVYKIMKEKLENNISDDSILAELDKKKDEFYKQQVKTRDKLRELRLNLRDEARIENLKETFVECAKIISKEKPLTIEKYPINSGDKICVLQLSDWHFDEIVDNFLNTYNHDVFNSRIKKLTNDVLSYCKLMNVRTLKVLNQGDLITGNIRVSARVNSEEDAVYQTQYVAETLATMLTEFAKDIHEVELYSVLDNHSRINSNKNDHIEKESFARFIPWYLEVRLKDVDNIKIIKNRINEIEEFDIGVFDIYGEKAFFTHGHNDKVASIIPDLTLMTKMFPIAVFVGHWHKNVEDEVHGIDLVMNPSLIGVGEFSKNIRKTSRPRQKLTIYGNDNGAAERVGTFFINL